MGKMKNQAITSHPLFFDPLNKKVEFRSGERKMSSLVYVKEREGVIVHDNGDVEFCYYAPGAKRVQVAGFTGSMPREKIDLVPEGNGYFSKKVSRIPPGFHYHDWFVDGNKVRNQLGAFCYGCFEPINFFEIPEGEDDFYLMRDVPHGEVRIELYPSGVNGHMKSCYVYTPPRYNSDKAKTYPVLYLLHGAGEDETGWIWNGKVNFIMDNLLAQGKCREMLVVMCNGYAFREGEDPVFYPGDFDRELIQDCIPFIEKSFRVKKGKGSRAIAGLSLGSAQATLTVSKHMELFSALGAFSETAIDELDRILSDDREKLSCIFLTAGKGEDRFIPTMEEYSRRFEEKNIPCIHLTFPGYHEWHVWRKSFHAFVQHIFTWPEDREESNGKPQAGETETNRRNEISLSPELLTKQTYEMHPLAFDPVYKRVAHAVDERGRPAGRYRDVRRGVVVLDQGRVQFNFVAPEATSVEVRVLGMDRLKLHKANDPDAEEGLWTGILENVEPGFHYHEYYLNGVQVVNPRAPLGYGCFKPLNYFEMPEPKFDAYLLKDVPHGSIRMNYYQSSVTGRMKMCYVYTPPGYDQKPDRNYPVLYLQHGGGENEVGWIWQGKICCIMDNLLAERKCEEMLIVMNTGYSFREDGTSHPQLGSLDEEMVKDCIPFIDKTYRTITNREGRAMAGLSMGGMQTQKTVFHHPELFAWAGIFSGGLTVEDEEENYTDILYNPEQFKKTFKMLYVACGQQDGLYEMTARNVLDVQNHGIPLEVFYEPGYHDWTFWRHCATDFIKKVFR